ncbi:MAG: hypothetical protein CL458_07180 [Acidimicrobiaceae bacterium]|nr:hypothetical protein [Acidimicrobiaceae bacterium]|tara:strand:- start:9309 stop:9695 length:387 start_codon:yes stop_codon:yes gene_type:complete
MRSAGVLIALLLAASCASNESVSSEDFAALKADVEQVSADVQAITSVTKNTKKGFDWPDDYQEGWRDICTVIIKDAATADPEAQAPGDVCGCTLKGLMGAFALKDYESWPQDVKDGAASPYLSMCWNK